MALLEEQFTETLDAGAPDITYEGSEGREQQIARELWDNLPPEAQQQFGSFHQFFSSGAWKQVLQMLRQQMQQQAPQQMSQQGLGSMMPAQMANGGMLMASDPGFGDGPFMLDEYLQAVKEGYKGTYDDFINEIDRSPADYMAYGGIAGADGRRQYGIGSWFQEKIMDPIKNVVKSPLGKTAALLGGAYLGDKYLLGGRGLDAIQGGLSGILKGGKKVLDTTIGTGDDAKSLGSYLMNPNFLIPAAGLVAGTFAKKDDPGYTGQGTGLNLRDVGRIANITDPKTAMASGLRFSPDLETRKFTPAEMLESYAATDAKDFSTPGAAQGGRIGAQEGGLMSLGGMEMDLRGGGFVPIGAKEKADDVPARLSKNEFVFTADAVRAAGGGDVDAGADKMYNTMKQLESRVG